MTVTLPTTDVEIVRGLARQISEIAALPVQAEKAELWRRLNGLNPARPMVMLQCDTWNEVLTDDALQCTDPFCRNHERWLRHSLYQWAHFNGDNVFETVMYSPIVTHVSGWGLEIQMTRPDHYFGAAHFEPVIKEEKDIEKMTLPTVTVDWEETERQYQRHSELYDGIFPVIKRGSCSTWFAIIDHFIQWRGLEQTFEDMYDRPEWLHRALDLMTRGMIGIHEAMEREGVLSLNNSAIGVGPGGYGYTDLLPQADFTGHVRAKDMWGHATTQIFSEVSPAMHEEFALQYEGRYLARFGLAGYGCCEPLHHKLDIIKRHIPHLRRVSMSPWANIEVGAAALGNTAVFSYKPNPAVLGDENWDPEYVRAGLRDVLRQTRGCTVEIIMKDLHTCHQQPHRLDEWMQVAMEVAEEFAY
jgi:hypothetical protein